jgi:hypothetical protein
VIAFVRKVPRREVPDLFKDFVGAGEQRGRHLNAERFGCFEIDREVELHRLFDGQVPRLRTLQNAINVVGHAAITRDEVWTIPDKAPNLDPIV